MLVFRKKWSPIFSIKILESIFNYLEWTDRCFSTEVPPQVRASDGAGTDCGVQEKCAALGVAQA